MPDRSRFRQGRSSNSLGFRARSLSASNSVAPATGDPYWANVAMLLVNNSGTNGGSTFIDQSSNAWTVSNVGSPTWDNTHAPGTETTSLKGVAGAAITVPDNAALEIGASQDFTFEIWVYRSAAGFSTAFTKRANSGVFAPIQIITAGGTNYELYASSSGASWDVANGVVIGAMTTGAWQHVAVSRSGSNIRTYLDGVAGGTASSSSALLDNSAAWSVNAAADGSGSSTNTWLASFRYTLAARYTAAFTPPTPPLPNS